MVVAKELPVKQCIGSGTLEIKVVELVHLKGHQLLAHIRTTMLALDRKTTLHITTI